MFPAAAVSCFAICYTGVQIAPTPRNYGDAMQNFFVSMAVGAVSGATIFGLMLWRAIAPRRKSHGPRIWTYEDGTKVDASLVQCGEAEVVLRKLDNVEVQVPITLLCEGDREWLKNKKRK